MNYLENISLKKLITLIKTEIKNLKTTIENKLWGTSNIANNSITRAKLADDALYSPVAGKTANYSIVAGDLGKTLFVNSSSAITLTLTATVASALPTGAEIAVLRLGTGAAKLAFTGTGPSIGLMGEGQIRKTSTTTTTTVQIPEQYGMMAMKKIGSTDWVLTGNVEVV